MEQTDFVKQRNLYRRRRRKRRIRQKLISFGLLVFVIAIFVTFSSGFKSVVLRLYDSVGISNLQNNSTTKDTDNWQLRLVNSENPMPKNYAIETVTLSSGLKVDKRCYPDLQDMMDDCRAAGLSPIICSAYRTQEYQEDLFRKKVDWYLEQGYDEKYAEEEAGKEVAVPGTSEHQLGLALDIVDSSYQTLDEKQEDTDVQRWLLKHSWEYGFILRYPTGKSDITGIIYEPWHYRYVGKEAAEQIHNANICLEEYLR